MPLIVAIAIAAYLYPQQSRSDPLLKIKDVRARAILRECFATYKGCHRYLDTGEEVTVFKTKGKPDEAHKTTFQTYFVAPGKIRFDFQNDYYGKMTHFYLWGDGTKVQEILDPRETRPRRMVFSACYWDDFKNQLSGPEDVTMGIAAYTGVSSGTSDTVPSLLVDPDHAGDWFYSDLVIAGSDKVLDSDCYRLESKAKRLKLWIDKRLHLIRRFTEIDSLDGDGPQPSFDSVDTTTYWPKLNSEVKMSMFHFVPPK